MVTTIQISQETHEILTKMRENFGVESYNEVVNKLIEKSFPKKSFYGFLGKRNRKEILKDLRDKNDRI